MPDVRSVSVILRYLTLISHDWRHPQKDRDRTVYGLKEKNIGKMFVKIMKINKVSDDAQALLNWRLPGVRTGATGDFTGRCYEVIKKRPMRTTPGDLTVADVNEMLDRLSASSKEYGKPRPLQADAEVSNWKTWQGAATAYFWEVL